MQSERIGCEELLHAPATVRDVLRAARGVPGLALLESSSSGYGLGRYSILSGFPRKEIRIHGYRIETRERDSCNVRRGEPLDALRTELDLRPDVAEEAFEGPFRGGAIGYFAYDFGRRARPDALRLEEERATPDARFGIYDAALVWDHREGTLRLAWDPDRPHASDTANRLRALVAGLSYSGTETDFDGGEVVPAENREAFTRKVGKVRELILGGEVYQVNLSHAYSGEIQGTGMELYHRLRTENPAPYSAYLNFGDEEILSSSPERFLHCRGGVVNTRPIKGTRPRGGSAQEKAEFERELAASEKDRAELLMIVDLERNDMGRVCRPGSIDVENLFSLETYASVIHQTASVTGRLAEDRDVLDCIGAMFPGGSITGAPKIRAMEIIGDLESGDRGIYTGAIGYIGFDGNADLNIAIRTMRLADGELSFRVGSGIVWDSDPDSEYEETLHKAQALFKAIGRQVNGE